MKKRLRDLFRIPPSQYTTSPHQRPYDTASRVSPRTRANGRARWYRSCSRLDVPPVKEAHEQCDTPRAPCRTRPHRLSDPSCISHTVFEALTDAFHVAVATRSGRVRQLPACKMHRTLHAARRENERALRMGAAIVKCCDCVYGDLVISCQEHSSCSCSLARALGTDS